MNLMEVDGETITRLLKADLQHWDGERDVALEKISPALVWTV